MDKQAILQELHIGSRVAEDEKDYLDKYFIETNEYKKILKDDVDVIYGAKGTGKSALYLNILKNKDSLLNDGIIIIQAETIQGTSAFNSVVEDPPTSENTFRNIWKLYFLVLLYENFASRFILNKDRNHIRRVLHDSKLLSKNRTLLEFFTDAYRYIKNNPFYSMETGIMMDPNNGTPIGFTGKIIFSDTGMEQNKNGCINIDNLFEIINNLLIKKRKRVWLMLDRLDSVFEGKDVLEENAIRGLFKAYLDMRKYQNIREKIFLRTDIWDKITKKGFREASHIIRTINIAWTEQSILNLIIKRFIENEIVIKEFGLNKNDVISDYKNQEILYYRLFPGQVEKGEKRPATMKWILTRTSDANGIIAPREIIHLISVIIDQQISNFKMGKDGTEADNLFDRSLFKSALEIVSKTKIEQTVFAEYNDMKDYIQKFIGQRATNSMESISRLLGKDKDSTLVIISRLQEIGFLAKKESNNNILYDIPFLYRPYLKSIQGTSE